MHLQNAQLHKWGTIGYEEAWKKQEVLLHENLTIKSAARDAQADENPLHVPTKHHLIFCEHPAVYTLGKNGNSQNILISQEDMKKKGIEFFHTNRGGDITFHGPGQIVGYPIFDLEKIKTDIGWYLRTLEEVIIQTIKKFGITGDRSIGETGVWLEPAHPLKARKICAMGVRCSRWVTMHGFALNVNTDLAFFNHIIPCGIQQKKVSSMACELGTPLSIDEVTQELIKNFQLAFNLNFC